MKSHSTEIARDLTELYLHRLVANWLIDKMELSPRGRYLKMAFFLSRWLLAVNKLIKNVEPIFGFYIMHILPIELWVENGPF